ncbi:MAG TPA: phosphoenolpyruvate--protein phosphotransferase [Hyphomicrobiaceae bacterium]|jgi:phosphotransferase system enzyme I (PtsP)|nr:phosphoenolpyruvate--protein phosphotransferase [Hyphomicrobiaceae bacterium]
MNRGGDNPRLSSSEPALRIIMRRLREIMAEPSDGQSRLDKIVRQIAGLMVAEVCSIYLKRQDGSLELFATEGLNPGAVHNTFMRRGEGLVGRCAELAVPINEPDAQNHPAFSYRPETGEEIYHSLLAVPLLRGGEVLGVLTIQNKTEREYSDEDVEVLQTTAMVLAEHLLSGAVAGVNTAAEFSRAVPHVIRGQPLSEGLALGHAAVHESRVVVTELEAKEPAEEERRLDVAVEDLKASIDEMLDQGELAASGEHRDILEAYRMFAHDRGWLRRMKDAIKRGMTAEAAVERVQNDTRVRMLRQAEAYWHERLRDLDELSDRLLRILAGRPRAHAIAHRLPHDTILVARSMGPADLLDYDRSRLRGLVIEDTGGQSHVAIVAKALGIAAIGNARGVMERVDQGDPIIVDANAGEVHIRPAGNVIGAYADKARFQARRHRKYRALRDKPAVTKDGTRVGLHINAGLLVDMPHLAEAGADGVGLFRTELQFMISATLPRLERQTQMYRAICAEAAGKPVVFRTLDVGGDKVLPYLRQAAEENPALGWRAIRLALDRPGLLRTQVRALLRATDGAELRLLLPMVTAVAEIGMARALIDRELELLRRRGSLLPTQVLLGVMIEVPSLLFELDALLPLVDFISVGSNDLLQYFFAADRNNARVAARYDPLSAAPLRALRGIAQAAQRHHKPFSLCGEMAGRPLEAMALIGLGYRAISMAPVSIGPVKSMVMSLDVPLLEAWLSRLLDSGESNLRAPLKRFTEEHAVEI